MELTKHKVSDLKFAPYNPRKISEKELEKLEQSISHFGYVDPLIVNKRTGHVVGGNQRLKALKKLRVEEVETVEVDLSLDEEKALNVALNKISGEWDKDLLEDLLRDLENDLLPFTGFDEDELDDILSVPEMDLSNVEETDAKEYVVTFKMTEEQFNELKSEIDEFAEKHNLIPYVQVII